MPAQPTLGITMVSVRVPIEPPHGKRKGADDDPNIALEIHANGLRVWDSVNYSICADPYSFADAPSPLIGHTRNDLPDIPHFNAVYRYVAEQYVANRTNPLGKFLAPAVEAMDAALAARHGTSVYFAASGSRIKIGWSARVTARLAQLQTGNPDPVRLLATTPGGRALERRLHERFADARLAGEWFEATPELTTYIEQLAVTNLRRAA